MAKPKKKNRSFVIQPKEVQEMRHGSPSEEELKEFFHKRDRYIDAYGERIDDFIAISPIVPCDRWNRDMDPEALAVLSKQERATIKGRRIEARRRAQAKASQN